MTRSHVLVAPRFKLPPVSMQRLSGSLPVVQNTTCNDRKLPSCFRSFLKCYICALRRPGCRFKGMSFTNFCFLARTMIIKIPCWLTGCRTIGKNDTGSPTVSFEYSGGEAPRFRQVFNRPITVEDIELKTVRCDDIHRSHWV